MIFNSIEFAIFFPIIFFIYWFIVNKNLRLQNLFLLGASYFFYGWWDIRFLALLWFSSSIDWLVAYKIQKSDNDIIKKRWLALTLVSNLTILGFFKYFNFFVYSAASALQLFHIQASVPVLRIILPVGISFYTFQSISYVLDVYRKEIKASDDYFTFITFVSFFPQLVAGPIERAKHMLPQFQNTRVFNYAFAVTGMRFIIYGLIKKVVIADNLAKLVDEVFNNPSSYSGLSLIVATIFFSIQIYCDFSGYSDIAVGTARLLGFDLMQNFRTPYFSTSVREFWQRWHISLSTWFRDYLYIPLGGGRVTEPRKYLNILITFLISGLWHGANFTFVIWGGLHGIALVTEEILTKRIKFKMPVSVKWLISNAIICLAWIFFRARSPFDAKIIVTGFVKRWSIDSFIFLIEKTYHSYLFLGAVILITMMFFIGESLIEDSTAESLFNIRNKYVRWSVYYLIVFLIAFIGLNDNAPNFIYFKF